MNGWVKTLSAISLLLSPHLKPFSLERWAFLTSFGVPEHPFQLGPRDRHSPHQVSRFNLLIQSLGQDGVAASEPAHPLNNTEVSPPFLSTPPGLGWVGRWVDLPFLDCPAPVSRAQCAWGGWQQPGWSLRGRQEGAAPRQGSWNPQDCFGSSCILSLPARPGFFVLGSSGAFSPSPWGGAVSPRGFCWGWWQRSWGHHKRRRGESISSVRIIFSPPCLP